MILKYLGLFALVMTCTTGCQSYRRQPLLLTDYVSKWAARSLEVESIADYAASLANASGTQSAFDSSDGLSLHEAEAVALHFNPQLRIVRAQANVPLASAKEAGWWPDPKFQAQVLRFVDRTSKPRFRLDGLSFEGVNAGGLETTPLGYRRPKSDFIDDPWIISAGLSITVPISGRLAVEKDLRWTQYSAAWRGILLAEWSLLTRLRTAWLEWSTSQERWNAAVDYVNKLESIADITRRLMSAGELKPTESRLLSIELARRRASILRFEREVEQKRLTLFAMMGLSPSAPVSLHADVFIPTITVPLDQWRAAVLEHHPQIKAVEADYETAEQQVRLEIRKQYPDLDIGPSYSLDEGLRRIGFGVGLPIPLWNRNRQAIAEALAQRDAARMRAHATVESVLSQFAEAQTRLTYAGKQRAVLLEYVAPLVAEQVAAIRTLLDLGEIDVLLLRDALSGSLETKLELLDATLAEARAANDVQQMLRPRWFTPSDVALENEN